MATFADKLRKKSFIARENSFKHNSGIDDKVLDFIYKLCDNVASIGGFQCEVKLSQIKREVGTDNWYLGSIGKDFDSLNHICRLLEDEGLVIKLLNTSDKSDTLMTISWSVWNDWKDGEAHE